MADEHDNDLGVDAAERARLAEVSEQLHRHRPVPRAAFRGDLRRQLSGTAPARRDAPAHVPAPAAARWPLQVTLYSVLGVLLLALPAIGLAGAGPFGA